ncbi:hypothetical protein Q4591_05195 [Shewanella sp. 3_MG-2023]|uniref:hypothetical protein n=1 Tax=unclassified Shewanella TaxID=196818 RepID=UPI0026E3A585|nr:MULTISPECIES: hypothetical protein [unclassified Shewanella]MDO6618598.1 hypothetical protein [Shewanella sp. 6_MG-2023]MDO6774745.1 hypothetical protein [Shewanella sp. 3_MG-2023]
MLTNINHLVDETLIQLESLPSEDVQSDELVLKLQELVQRRQILLDEIKAKDIAAGEVESARAILNAQLLITQAFQARAYKILTHIQSLLNLKKKNKRQINLYQSVDANK